jgi:hypothetical protein
MDFNLLLRFPPLLHKDRVPDMNSKELIVFFEQLVNTLKTLPEDQKIPCETFVTYIRDHYYTYSSSNSSSISTCSSSNEDKFEKKL